MTMSSMRYVDKYNDPNPRISFMFEHRRKYAWTKEFGQGAGKLPIFLFPVSSDIDFVYIFICFNNIIHL